MARPRLGPFDYPWTPVTRPTVVTGHGSRRLESTASGPPEVPPRDAIDRHLLIAVGSNRSADVLAAKLAGVPGSVIVAPARVRGLGIGYSAHVSRRGYLPAAPYDRDTHRASGDPSVPPPSEAEVALLWLTEDQLVALDATEPNYDRVELDPDRYPVSVAGRSAGAAEPETGRPQIYATRRQLLAPAGSLLAFGSQAEVQRLLLSHPDLQSRLGEAVPGPAFCDRLADDDVRTAINELLPEVIGVRPAGVVFSS